MYGHLGHDIGKFITDATRLAGNVPLYFMLFEKQLWFSHPEGWVCTIQSVGGSMEGAEKLIATLNLRLPWGFASDDLKSWCTKIIDNFNVVHRLQNTVVSASVRKCTFRSLFCFKFDLEISKTRWPSVVSLQRCRLVGRAAPSVERLGSLYSILTASGSVAVEFCQLIWHMSKLPPPLFSASTTHTASGRMHLAECFMPLFYFSPWFLLPWGRSRWV